MAIRVLDPKSNLTNLTYNYRFSHAVQKIEVTFAMKQLKYIVRKVYDRFSPLDRILFVGIITELEKVFS